MTRAGLAVQAGEAVGEHQRIDEAGAGAGQIDRAGAAQAQPMCDQRARWAAAGDPASRWQATADRCRCGRCRHSPAPCRRHCAARPRQRVAVRGPEARPDAGPALDPAGFEPETVFDFRILDTCAPAHDDQTRQCATIWRHRPRAEAIRQPRRWRHRPVRARRRHAIGRQQIEDIAERTDEQAALEKERAQLRPDLGQITGRAGAQDRAPRSCRSCRTVGEAADCRGSVRSSAACIALKVGDPLGHRLVAPDLEIGERGGAGNRIGGVGTRMEEGLAAGPSNRWASKMASVASVAASGSAPPVRPFEVHRMSGEMPACSQANMRSGAAPAGHHLVGDQQRAGGLGDLLQRGQNRRPDTSACRLRRAPAARRCSAAARPVRQMASKRSSVSCSRPAAGKGSVSTSNSSGS